MAHGVGRLLNNMHITECDLLQHNKNIILGLAQAPLCSAYNFFGYVTHIYIHTLICLKYNLEKAFLHKLNALLTAQCQNKFFTILRKKIFLSNSHHSLNLRRWITRSCQPPVLNCYQFALIIQ